MSGEVPREIHVAFENVSAAEANRLADSLKKRFLELTDQQIQANTIKSSQSTMDFGTTLVLVFGTPAAIAVAKGLYEALKRLPNIVVVKTREGTVIASGDGAANMSVHEVLNSIQK